MKKHILIFCFLFSLFTFNKGAAQISYKWAKGFTAPNTVLGSRIAVNKNDGSVYITGAFSGKVDFDFGPGTADLTASGLGDIFIAKYKANGNYLWAKHFGGNSSSYSEGSAIALDLAGDVYVTGSFYNTVYFGSTTLTCNGTSDIFLAKLDELGNLSWVKQAGGHGTNLGLGITADNPGNIYLTGSFEGAAIFGSISPLNNSGGGDIFLSKYDPSGTCLWANSIGSTGEDKGLSVSLDGAGKVYLAGTFNDSIFFAKYDVWGGGGSAELFFKTGSVNGTDIANCIAPDGRGNIFLSGNFEDSVSFNNGHSLISSGMSDIFFAKYNSSGVNLWAKKIGSYEADSVYGSCLDTLGNLYLTGHFNGTVNFNPLGTDELNSPGYVFYAKYDSVGHFKWARNVGGCSNDHGTDIAVDNSGNLYTLGEFNVTADFDPGVGTAILNDDGQIMTAFFEKFAQGTSMISGNVKKISGVAIDSGKVKLFTYSTNSGAMNLADEKSINLLGGYSFNYVCADSFIVLAIADTLVYPLVAPTFAHSTAHWHSAQHIIITAPNTSISADIIVKADSSIISGPAMIGGKVREGPCYGCRAQGDPIPGIPVGLEGDPGSIIAHTITNDSGVYSFTHLPVGNYKIYVNIPGLPMDSTYHVNIASSDTFPHLDFIADSIAIYIIPTITSVVQTIAPKINMQAVPNPHQGYTTIEFTMPEANLVQIDAYNLLGEKVAEVLNEKKAAGIVRYGFDAVDAGLKPGVYFLKLKAGSKISTIKMIQVE